MKKILLSVYSRFSNLFKIYAIILVLALVVSTYLQVWETKPESFLKADITSFVAAGKAYKNHEGENLYKIDLQKEAFRQAVGIASDTISFSPFRHLPAVAWAFSFVPDISLELIYKIALVVNIILLTALIFLLSNKFTWIKKFNIFLPLIFVFVPVLASIRNGQLSILFTLLFVGIFFLIQKTKYFWAGILSGLIAIKLQMLLAVPFIFFSIKKDKSKYLIGFFISLFVFFVLNNFLAPGFYLQYLRFLVYTEVPGLGSYLDSMPTVDKFLLRSSIFDIGQTSRLGVNFALYFLTLITFALAAQRKRFNKGLLFAYSILLSIPFSIHFITHDKVLFLIPSIILINEFYANRDEYALWVGIIILFLININIGNGIDETILMFTILSYPVYTLLAKQEKYIK